MQAALRRHLDEDRIPGLVALVHQRGREHVEAIGTLALDSNAPMRRDTIFRLASMTKPVTAVGAMILVEECQLRLDDPVDEWLPELKDRQVLRTIESPLDDTVPAQRPITLRDLLTFRSGYGEVAFIAPTSALQQAMVEARLPLSTWPFAGTSDEFMKRLGSAPARVSTGGAMAVPHGQRDPGRADRSRLRHVAGDVSWRAHLRASRDEGHRVLCAGGEARPAADLLRDGYRHRRVRGPG